jgi:hypothetical protein
VPTFAPFASLPLYPWGNAGIPPAPPDDYNVYHPVTIEQQAATFWRAYSISIQHSWTASYIGSGTPTRTSCSGGISANNTPLQRWDGSAYVNLPAPQGRHSAFLTAHTNPDLLLWGRIGSNLGYSAEIQIHPVSAASGVFRVSTSWATTSTPSDGLSGPFVLTTDGPVPAGWTQIGSGSYDAPWGSGLFLRHCVANWIAADWSISLGTYLADVDMYTVAA